jgi:hypothetical protein
MYLLEQGGEGERSGGHLLLYNLLWLTNVLEEKGAWASAVLGIRDILVC